MQTSTQSSTIDDFDRELHKWFAEAEEDGALYIDVEAGILHRRVGGYPGKSHCMPVCCSAMRKAICGDDMIIASPPKGNGASLTVRYKFPR